MTRTVRVLYVGNDGDREGEVATLLGGAEDVSVATEADPERATDRIRDGSFDCVLVHEATARSGDRPFPEVVREADPDVAVVLLTGEADEDGATAVGDGTTAAVADASTPAADDGAVDERIPGWATGEGAEPFAARIRAVVEGVEGTAREAELARAGIGPDGRNSGGVVGVLDGEGRFEYVPRAAGSLVGGDPEDLAGRRAIELVHPEDRAEVRAALATLVDHPERPLVAEFRLERAGGGWLWVEGRTMSTEAGAGVLVQARDRAASAGETRRIEAMVKHSSDVITVLDGDGTIRYESPAARRVKGVDPAAVVGRSAFEFVHPDDHERIREALSVMAGRPGAVTDPVEYRIRDDDGNWRWLESVGSNPGPEAPVDGYVVNSRNVTERVERERQLRVLDRVLRHNVRNHLDVVMGHAERVSDPGRVDLDDACDRVLRECEGLLATVEKEREIVRLLTDPPDRTRVDCSAAVRAAASDVRERYPDATVDVSCPPGVAVEAIPGIRRALAELVENAVEHGDPPVTVTVRRREGTVVVAVADEGPTIPDDEVAVLLDARGIDQLHHGSGMGLWLVHWIVRRSGGDLAFEPGDPTGNVVTVTLQGLAPDNPGDP